MTDFISSVNLTELRHLGNIFLIILVSLLVRFLIHRAVHIFFGKAVSAFKNEKTVARTKTTKYLLLSIFDAVLIFISILTVLSNLGLDIGPILTGAGILGLAVSFGAQSLIKDFLSGFFIILEEQFNVGDEVKIGAFEGKVAKLTLRTTVLKDDSENLIFIPNSQIFSVLRKKK